jgi:outer membrane protein OmpA-like peptidoglycan-associated protein
MFKTDSARILPRTRQTLAAVARRLAGRVRSVSCTGHTDAVGRANYNLTLGLARANAVCRYLQAHGVKGAIDVASRGEGSPRSSNAIPAGRARNRRVELTVTYH